MNSMKNNQFARFETYEPEHEPMPDPEPIEPKDDPTETIEPYTPLPVEEPKVKPKKCRKKLFFIIGLFIGYGLAFAFIATTDLFIKSSECEAELTTSYNEGASYIIDYTLSNNELPYFDNNELKHMPCGS